MIAIVYNTLGDSLNGKQKLLAIVALLLFAAAAGLWMVWLSTGSKPFQGFTAVAFAFAAIFAVGTWAAGLGPAAAANGKEESFD
ncbi:hypothetical protein [Arthrobacter sp. EpRS71]|uniref:hypothetical protein n=1 Tax=Arthrobacter sp. EpRS71 TaxID=1743141 RepID=UPI0007465C35|nr:hypothetical protein [Arthrobacter sp. EpRS71]KUM34522.1 hypothetical protein AR689_10285 [Arthrobacter sp. EpRS71]